jgi:hypothetical protein
MLFDRVTVFLEKVDGDDRHQIQVTVPWHRVRALRRVNRIAIAGGRTCDVDLHQIDNDAVKNETVGTFLCRVDPLDRSSPE